MFRQTVRRLNAEVKDLTAAKAIVKPVPAWRTRISSFLAGVAVTSIFGYMRLREDVYASTNDLKSRLEAAHADTSVLLARIQALEGRVNNVEEKKILSSPVIDAVALPVAGEMVESSSTFHTNPRGD